MRKENRKINIKLREHIEASGKTQAQFADDVGLRKATVSQLVNNKYDRIQLSHLLTIMDAIGTEDFNDVLEIADDEA
jgi:predicted XRE-type DNA-binding protein